MQPTDEGKQFDPYAAPKAAVWTAEVSASQEPEKAGRLIRLVAVFLDGVFGTLAAAPFLVTVLMVLAQASGDPSAADMFAVPTVWVGLAVSGVLWLGLFVLTLVLLAKYGQSPAKRLLKIRIVRNDGSRAGLGRIFWLRMIVPAVIGAIPIVGPIFSLVDALMIFGDARRCLHDLIADTKVVVA
ncbi:MAG: RDD family protein [Planctomycetota bacterium]|nr:MAG: RDD family protein [Planctomycetota bacterium]